MVDRCLAKAPDDRFPSGAELADELAPVLTAIPALAPFAHSIALALIIAPQA